MSTCSWFSLYPEWSVHPARSKHTLEEFSDHASQGLVYPLGIIDELSAFWYLGSFIIFKVHVVESHF
jgi:hypothetical protein